MPELSGLVEHPTPRPYPFGPTSIATILEEGLSAYPDRLALIDGDRTWTWAELDGAVAAVAGGIAPGEQIEWSLGNRAEQIIGILATFRAGGIWIASAHDSVQRQVPIRHPTLHRTGRPVAVDPHAPAVVMFTSGTTGRPKAVVHSQHNLLAPGLVSIEVEPPQPGERIGTPLDLANANIVVLGPISALLRGSTFVVLASRYAPALAANIATHSVTRLFAVPTLAFDLVEREVEREDVSIEQLQSLNRVILGGSGADPALLRRFAERFGVRPTLSYGMSEAPTGIVRESFDDPIGSGRGFPLPHVEIEILDASGARVEDGVDGEICVRPIATGEWANTWTGTLGYVGEPERSAELFRGGVLHTGDRGHLDADGALSVTGRLSDVIIRGGKNVDPLRVEAGLAALPSVHEALVVAIPDVRLGQKVGALLVLSGDVAPDDLERLDIDAFKLIDAFEIVDELPRNAMGKVIRERPPGRFNSLNPSA